MLDYIDTGIEAKSPVAVGIAAKHTNHPVIIKIEYQNANFQKNLIVDLNLIKNMDFISLAKKTAQNDTGM